jgi:hypothetical protein
MRQSNQQPASGENTMTIPTCRPLARTLVIAAAAAIFASGLASAQQQPSPDLPSDIPAKLKPADQEFDFAKRDVMIPMRDGVKLHTVILLPKGLTHAPLLLTRTP